MSKGPDKSIGRRLEFIGIDAKTREALRSLTTLFEGVSPGALDLVYKQIRAFPETSRFFSDDAQIARASRAQSSHWSNILRADFDEAYVTSARVIGGVHARIGLEPRWYIGAYALIIEQMIRAIVASDWPSSIRDYWRADEKPTVLADRIVAFLKGVMLDMDLVISIYFEMAEQQRREAEQAAISAEQDLVSKSFGSALAALSNGDLTSQMTAELPAAYSSLKIDFNSAVQRLHQTLRSVVDSSGQITRAATELASAADDQARRTEQQAASLEETAAALNEITASVQQGATRSAEARELARIARDEAESGGQIIDRSITAIEKIENSSRRIADILNVIDEMAFQTNLLALNAGVEAARAGDAGKGFAVVASEVRGLAQRSAEAAKEIKKLIAESRSEVEEGVALVTQSGHALSRIRDSIGKLDTVVSDISSGAKEQAMGLSEVNTALGHMDQITQQNAAMVEESAAACHSVLAEAEDLMKSMGQFRVSGAREHDRNVEKAA